MSFTYIDKLPAHGRTSASTSRTKFGSQKQTGPTRVKAPHLWYTSLWNLELIDIFADQIANTCMAIHIQSYRQHYQCHLGALVSINRCSATDIILPFAQKSRRNTRVSTLFTLFWPFSIWWETKSSSGDNFYNMTRLSNKRMFNAVLWAKKQTRFLFEIAYH